MEDKKEMKEKLLDIINACICDPNYLTFTVIKGGYVDQEKNLVLVSPKNLKTYSQDDILVLKFDDQSEIKLSKIFKSKRVIAVETEVVKKLFFIHYKTVKKNIDCGEFLYEYVIQFNDSIKYSISDEEAIEIIRVYKENKKAYDDSRVENSINEKFDYFKKLKKD